MRDLRTHSCPADGNLCEVSDRIDWGEAPLLPCGQCRVHERLVTELSGFSLGKHGWRLLLLSKAPELRGTFLYAGDAATLEPPEPEGAPTYSSLRSIEEMTYEAARRLRDRGLLRARPDPGHPPPRGKLRLWRTPLGEKVVSHCQRDYEQGNPIRWRHYEDSIRIAGRLDTDRLKQVFADRLREIDRDRWAAPATGETLTPTKARATATKNASPLLELDDMDERLNRRFVGTARSRVPNRAEIVTRTYQARRTT
jgi:hypothetical protein